MKSFFRKRKHPHNLRSRKNAHSTPTSKVRVCVECHLPFDEDKIAPELRRGTKPQEGTRPEPLESSQNDSEGCRWTTLEPVEISVVSNNKESYNVLARPVLANSLNTEKEDLFEKDNQEGKQTDTEAFTENTFAAGGRQVPVITSPVNSTDSELNAFGAEG